MSNKGHTLMAVAALILSVLSVAAGDFERLDATVAARQIDVTSVAERIRAREPMVLVDLRNDGSRQDFSLPTAISLDEARSRLKEADKAVPVVVYGHERDRRWLVLRRLGYSISFVDDAISKWITEIADPTIRRDASADAWREFEAKSDLARYFGGVPRVVDETQERTDTGDQLAALRRRGCGF